MLDEVDDEEVKEASPISIQMRLREQKLEDLKRIRFIIKGKFSSLGLIRLKILQSEGETGAKNHIVTTDA